MAITINGTTGITNDGGYTGDGVVFADTTPANTLVTTTGGNVGIGTSSPAYKLSLVGAQNATVFGASTAYGAAGEVYSAFRFENSSFSGGNSEIRNLVNGAASTGSSLAFFTTQTGSGPLTERARIDTSGNFLLSQSTQYYGSNQYNNKKYMIFNYPTSGFGSNNDCTDFYTAGNGNASVQMRVTQLGNVGCRGAFSGGQTLNDYAEYFEWSDGNPDNEDRIGVTVVLDGGKIRPSTQQDSGDDIVGVVSGTAGVVLGSSPFEWAGKYQKDEFGRIITEQVNWVHWSEDGTHHNYKVGKVPSGVVVPADAEYKTYDNPVVVAGYDEAAEYQSRDQRKEWAPIGLVGQVHVKNGQLVGSRWRKMKDVSANVALWLIR
jgi:hypothetical protein